jgi:hypothetical protein
VVVHTHGGHGVEDADITCFTPDGRILWIEYEHPGSHNQIEIGDKKTKQMRYCDIWKCVCQRNNAAMIKKAVGGDFYLVRGDAVKKYLEYLSCSQYVRYPGAAKETET